ALLLLCRLLLHADGLSGTAAGAGVGASPLAADRQATPVAESAVGTDLHQPLDVERDLPAKLAFHLGLFVDHVSQASYLLVSKVLDPNIGVDVGNGQHPARRGGPDAEDVGQVNLD